MDGEVWPYLILGREDTNMFILHNIADSLGCNDGEPVSGQRFARLASCFGRKLFDVVIFFFIEFVLFTAESCALD